MLSHVGDDGLAVEHFPTAHVVAVLESAAFLGERPLGLALGLLLDDEIEATDNLGRQRLVGFRDKRLGLALTREQRPNLGFLGAELLKASQLVIEDQCIDVPRTEGDLQPPIVQDLVIALYVLVAKYAPEGRQIQIIAFFRTDHQPDIAHKKGERDGQKRLHFG